MFQATILLDGRQVASSGQIGHGFELGQPSRSKLTVSVPSLSHSLSLNLATKEVQIKAPYSLFAGKMEGLCGKSYICFLLASFFGMIFCQGSTIWDVNLKIRL